MSDIAAEIDAIPSWQPSADGAEYDGPDQEVSEPPCLDPRDPLAIAKLFLKRHYVEQGLPTLWYYSGAFYEWSGAGYGEADGNTIKARLWTYLENAERWCSRTSATVPFKPTTPRVNDALEALRAAANLPRDIRPPSWLAGGPATPPEPSECLACKNAIVHLPSRSTERPTPAFWTWNGLDFDYRANPPEPTGWWQFLDQLWPDDQQARETLQELFGYLLTPDTSQQKLFLLIGPKRSGKGTIIRVLQALLGHENVVSPTLNSLAQNFGLAPLIGKTAALIADARLSGRTDTQAIAERLLSISGEDALTVDRKYRDAWTGPLQVRFLMCSNELPRLSDASGALASRFVPLVLTNSFYGKEDHGLTKRLLDEMPGILHWAIEGWERLNKRGYFILPDSSKEAMDDLEALTSPISTFIKERCFIASGASALPNDLYEAWKDWCSGQGRDHVGTLQSFSRDLKSAIPGIKTMQARDLTGKRYRAFEGVRLLTEHEM